jgi:hypothetical protein
LRDVGGALADHHAEFHFPVHLGRIARLAHVVVRTLQAGHGLGEDDRLGRRGLAGLGGVIRIIQADRDELARAGKRDAQALDLLHHRQRRERYVLECSEPVGRQPRRAEVGQVRRQVPHHAVLVDHARFFLSNRAKPNEFHHCLQI